MTSRPLGPIPGLLPPSRRPATFATAAASSAPSSDGNSYAYSLNWRPSEVDVKAGPDAEAARVDAAPRRAAASPLDDAAAHGSGHRGSRTEDNIFRASLADSCPVVDCFRMHAFSCAVSGVLCTLEQEEEEETNSGHHAGLDGQRAEVVWRLHCFPSQAQLSASQVLGLSQAVYACLYAALSRTGEPSMRMHLIAGSRVSASVSEAMASLGLSSSDRSTPITPSYVLQLFHYADTRFLTPPFPYIPCTSFSGQQPVVHPFRRPQGSSEKTLYSRFLSSLNGYMVVKGVEGRGGRMEMRVGLHASSGGFSGALSNATGREDLEVAVYSALESPMADGAVTDDYDRSRLLVLTGVVTQAEKSFVIQCLTLQRTRTRRWRRKVRG